MKLNKNKKQFVAFYDEINLLYNIIYPNYQEHNRILANSLVKYKDFKNIRIFVDLGCGVSNLIYELAKMNYNTQFIGIDFSSNSIKYCKENYILDNLEFINDTWENGLRRITKTYKEIDLLICFGNTICHYNSSEQLSLTNTIKCYLSPEGEFLYDAYKKWNEKFKSNDYVFEPKYLSKDISGNIYCSAFFTKYNKFIAYRNILISVYSDLLNLPTEYFHYKTWQYPINKNIMQNIINLEDKIGIFEYYKL